MMCLTVPENVSALQEDLVWAFGTQIRLRLLHLPNLTTDSRIFAGSKILLCRIRLHCIQSQLCVEVPFEIQLYAVSLNTALLEVPMPHEQNCPFFPSQVNVNNSMALSEQYAISVRKLAPYKLTTAFPTSDYTSKVCNCLCRALGYPEITKDIISAGFSFSVGPIYRFLFPTYQDMDKELLLKVAAFPMQQILHTGL